MTPVSLFRKTIYNRSDASNKNKAILRMNPPSRTSKQQSQHELARQIAKRFVDARQQARALTGFPGTAPTTLDDAYRIQDIAIELWGQRIGGWKVGRIPLDLEEKFESDRLAGPIFASTIHEVASGSTIEMPIFVGGFAALEAEFVVVIDRDAPADHWSWTPDEAREMIADLRIGLEVASSPLATINELGPAVVVSDFGNNLGLVVGPTIHDWQSRSLETMSCSARIDDQPVGEGGAYKLTGGIVRSVQFLLELAARRGLPLRAGDMIATGQTTGIHDIAVGQSGITDFGNDGWLGITTVAAKPQ
ncbi:MAG: fumarylacetoacetate hydrolase family protein [Gammaproteobacteria bacterium]|nr:fumarylacetoacetate hydrolase family protein [Gammaproteobacteria bacterium]